VKQQLIKRLIRMSLLCMSLFAIAITLPAIAAPGLDYEIIGERTHKPILFTQGLQLENNYFYESSGLYGKSMLVTYPLAEPASTWAKLSAPFTLKRDLPAQSFAEGLTILHNKLYLLTWQEGTLLIYDKTNLNYLASLSYQGEGWGLTNDGKKLIRSDGSDTLYFHNPEDFSIVNNIKVRDGNQAVSQLNELEFADGFIWANIWHNDRIVKIDPATGSIVNEVNLAELRRRLKLTDTEQVLNGIAWSQEKKAFWVTGKNWPKMFLVKIKNKQ
jgi:glutamine cyclotransferase